MYWLVVELVECLIDLIGGVLGYSFFGFDGVFVVEIVFKMSFYVYCNVG